MLIQVIYCKFDRILRRTFFVRLDEWIDLPDSILDFFCYALAAYYDTAQGFYDYLPTQKKWGARSEPKRIDSWLVTNMLSNSNQGNNVLIRSGTLDVPTPTRTICSRSLLLNMSLFFAHLL